MLSPHLKDNNDVLQQSLCVQFELVVSPTVHSDLSVLAEIQTCFASWVCLTSRSQREDGAGTEDAAEKGPHTSSMCCVPCFLLSALNRVRDRTSVPPWMWHPDQVQLMAPM